MNRWLPLLNALGVLATILVNLLANLIPIGGRTTGEVSEAYANLFTPAGFTFAIWGLIYLLLLIFAADQILRWLRPRGDGVVAAIGWWFVLASVANISWIFAWHYEQIGLSLLLMLLLLTALIAIYTRLGIGVTPAEWRTRLAVHLPFSLYLGWITVATIANVTVWLVSLGWQGFGPVALLWTILVLGLATGITLLMLRNRGDIAFALVVLWACFGILVNRLTTDPEPSAALTGWLLVCMTAIGLGIWRVITRRPRG